MTINTTLSANNYLKRETLKELRLHTVDSQKT